VTGGVLYGPAADFQEVGGFRLGRCANLRTCFLLPVLQRRQPLGDHRSLAFVQVPPMQVHGNHERLGRALGLPAFPLTLERSWDFATASSLPTSAYVPDFA
jgi:hypothetical protein